MKEGDSPRNNPYDADGTHWSIDSKPTITARIDSVPLWYDFDFGDSTGTICGSFQATDNNGQRDTVKVSAFWGTTPDTKDTLRTTGDSLLFFRHLKPGTKYYYKISATDSWDSVTQKSGSFVTSTGCPPKLSDSITVSGGDSYRIFIFWYGISPNTVFRIYRSTNSQGPFSLVHDTTIAMPLNYSGYYADYVTTNQPFYYVLAAANKFGECRSKKELSGSSYNSSLSSPNSLTASSGTYADFIYLSWYYSSYTYYGSSDYTYYIYKSNSSSGPFRIIDSTSSSFYRDTINDTSSGSYYKVSVRDSYGNRSAPSSSAYGYIAKLNEPYSVSASQGIYNSAVSISWSSVPSAYGYYIYRSLSYTGPFLCVGSTTTTSYIDSVKTSDTYYYEVAAYNKNKQSGYLSSYTPGYPKRLETPTSVSATQGTSEDQIGISWSSPSTSSPVKGYHVFRSRLTNNLDSLKLIDSTTATQYRDSVPTSDNYYYSLAAYDSTGRKSARSSPVCGYLMRLTAPLSYSASTSYYSCILLVWLSVANASGYYVYRSESSVGTYRLIDSTTTAQYTDVSVPIDSVSTSPKYYFYKIAAYSPKKKVGPQSSAFSGCLLAFSYPTGITASTNTYRKCIALAWDSVPRATGYAIYRSTSYSGAFSKLSSVSKTSYVDSALGNGASFYYKISSLKGTAETAQSSQIAGTILSAPSSLSVYGYSSYIYIAWTSPSDTSIKGFYLYRSTDGQNFLRTAVLNSYSSTTYSDYVQDSKKYYYKVSAFSRYDESDPSTILSCQRLPAIPSNVTATGHQAYSTVSWDSVPSATSYRIYRGTWSYSLSFVTSTARTSFNDSSATAGTYYYAVSAVNASGESLKSSTAYCQIFAALPGIPGGLSASGAADGIHTSWTATTGSVDGYHLYRSSDSGKSYSIAASPYYTSYTDAQAGYLLYYYKVSAYNGAGESALSSAVSARRLAPATPQNLSIGSPTTTYIPLAWQASAGATGYVLYRSQSKDSLYTMRATQSGTSFNDSTAQANTVFYYKVSAYNPVGESALSTYVSGMRTP